MNPKPLEIADPDEDRDFYDRNIAGLIPLWHVEREVHVVDGATYTLELGWFRRRVSFAYWTPRIPRAVERVRRAERERVRVIAERALAEARK